MENERKVLQLHVWYVTAVRHIRLGGI